MKKTLLFLVLFSFLLSTKGQTISGGEYFFDTAPAYGSGIAFSRSQLDFESQTLNFSVASLSEGFHTVYVRVKNTANVWSHYEGRLFYILAPISVTVQPSLVAGEWFLDTDPGLGNGTAIAFEHGNAVSSTISINNAALNSGFHSLYIRVKNDTGVWSHTEGRIFYVMPSTTITTQPSLVAGEWFLDTDPGLGNGNVIPFENGNAISSTISINNATVNSGFHSLYIRVKNEAGIWSHIEGRIFYVMPTSSVTTQPALVAGEWFLDTDPGIGNGTAIPFSQGNAVSPTISLNNAALNSGFHSLFIRVKNEAGVWSHYESRVFYVAPSNTVTSQPPLVTGEWFVDTDPGLGNGGVITFDSNNAINPIIDITPSNLSAGNHNLFIRVKNTNGTWSHFEGRPFSVENTVTPPPEATAQTFCNGATVENLVATGVNLRWYDNLEGGTALATGTVLSTKSYYVTQTINGFESNRTPVDITINTTPAPTAASQSFCNLGTIADLIATGTDIKWYENASGGTALDASTGLVTKTYYATQTLNSCESQRTAVSVGISTKNPTAFTYTNPTVSYCVGISIPVNYASFSDSGLNTYTVSPPLPNGLILNSTLGYITGVPTIASTATIYTITLTNGCGSATTDVTIGVNQAVQYYVDVDQDGYGSTTTAMVCSATPPAGYSTNNLDCNDYNAAINPAAVEICNGIDDNCDGLIDDIVPIETSEYLALVSLYNQLNGSQWTNQWDVSTNNLNTNKWFGVSTCSGHVTAINLSANNLSGIVPNLSSAFPNLIQLNLSSNKLSGIEAVLPASIGFIYDNQTIDAGDVTLNTATVINDYRINRYDHSRNNFYNQTYNVKIGSFSKTVTVTEQGLKLMDLQTIWNVPINQTIELTQISGDARNSTVNYKLKYLMGDANLDNNLNVLDIQTTVNYIMKSYINYFNYNAADVNNDTNVNVLDLIGQVKIIQDQNTIPAANKNVAINATTSQAKSKISIENGLLYLDTNGNEISSFEIRVGTIAKDLVKELISTLGFSVVVTEKNNYTSIIAYSFDVALKGKIALVEFIQKEPTIVSAILSDPKAVEVPNTILYKILEVNDLTIDKSAFNFPNPFSDETIIKFFYDQGDTKATLTIYDMGGKKVEQIPFEILTKGQIQYKFNRNKLSSGIYIYFIDVADNNLRFKGKMTIK